MRKVVFLFLTLFVGGCDPEGAFKDVILDVLEEAVPTDGDGDGVPEGPDCDDADDAVYPGVPEICDGIDNNCNRLVDEKDPMVADATAWYPDADGDGYGATGSMPVRECSEEAPTGGPWSSLQSDCDDDRDDVYPGAPELCDGEDNDCDGATDEAVCADDDTGAGGA